MLDTLYDTLLCIYSLLNDIHILSDDSWKVFLRRFSISVQHITGQEIEVKSPDESASRDIMEQEVESLRVKVGELSDEVLILELYSLVILVYSVYSFHAAYRTSE